MKRKFSILICYSLLVLVFWGCGTTDPISNSSGPSKPGNIFLNVDVVPPITNPGGSVIITATALFANNGIPASGITINAVSTAGGTISPASAATNSAGQVVFTYTVTTPATATFTLEDIFLHIRVNVNGL